MNLAEIFETTFQDESIIYLEEDELISESFLLSPLVAFLAFKDGVVKKVSSGIDAITTPFDKAAGQIDRLKSKLEINSGKNPNDTVYRFTKEQKEFLTYIYKKYGKTVLKEIQKFRTNVAAPYQYIKRSVAKNKTLTDKEVRGMTREEYEKYRESGAKKIKKMSTKSYDFSLLEKNNRSISSEIKELKNQYNEIKNGKGSINYTHIEKLLEKTGFGQNTLNKWPLEELKNTANKIAELENIISKQSSDGRYKLPSKKRGQYIYATKQEIKNDISYLKTFGYSSFIGKPINSDSKKGEFRESYNNYILRTKTKQDIEKNFNTSYKEMYLDSLNDEIKKLEKRNKNNLDDMINLNKQSTFNEYEKKIWGLKITGNPKSGNLDDWYLKIKPDDFKGVKTFKKSEGVIKAEKKFDKELKSFERKLKKIISEEDWNLLIKHRLINNFLTVKELKNPKSMFKSNEDIDKLLKNGYNLEEFKEEVNECNKKIFTSFKDLELKKKDIKNKISLFSGKELKEAKRYANLFLNKNDIGNKEDKTLENDLNNIINFVNEINSSEFNNVKEATANLRNLDNMISKFREEHRDDTSRLNTISYSLDKARNKLNSCINNGEQQ